jgi:cyclophilin family peptidyl-prolyl cis-trans isomerase
MKVISWLIIIVIVLIFYLAYVAYNSFKQNQNDNLEDFKNIRKISKKKNSELKKEEDKIELEIKEPNLIMEIKIDGSEESDNIELELFDDVVPITSKNFRIISKKGINNKKYDNNIFHRIIKNFMIQGGDILNQNGTGSISIFGDTFEDENFKLKHDQKGLLSMANSGPNTNGSQFFITTAPAQHLDNKHVVFGKVVKGYNIIEKIENLATDTNDKPYQTVRILGIKEK